MARAITVGLERNTSTGPITATQSRREPHTGRAEHCRVLAAGGDSRRPPGKAEAAGLGSAGRPGLAFLGLGHRVCEQAHIGPFRHVSPQLSGQGISEGPECSLAAFEPEL